MELSRSISAPPALYDRPAKGGPIPKAEITRDALLTDVSDRPVDHPLGVPAYEVRWVAPLINGQADLTDALLADQQAGSVAAVARSSIAQLGLELEMRNHRRVGSYLLSEGYALSVAGEMSDRLMNRIHTFMRQQHGVILGRTSLLPKEARVGRIKRVRRQVERGGVVMNGMHHTSDATILLPLGNMMHVFPDGQPTDELFDSILSGNGSGRRALNDARIDRPRPDVLKPGEFIVTDIDVAMRSHHLLLRPETLDLLNQRTDVRHLVALLLEAGRTQGGTRHAELWNTGKDPVDLRTLRIPADMYRPAEILTQGH